MLVFEGNSLSRDAMTRPIGAEDLKRNISLTETLCCPVLAAQLFLFEEIQMSKKLFTSINAIRAFFIHLTQFLCHPSHKFSL